MSKDRKKILNVDVDFGYSMQEVVQKADEMIKDAGIHTISTTNPEFIISAQNNEAFLNYINNSNLSLPDGSGVLYANYYLNNVSKLTKGPMFPVRAFLYGIEVGLLSVFKKVDLGEKIIGVDLMQELCKLAVEKNYTIFLLGGWPKDLKGSMTESSIDVASSVAAKLKMSYPNIHIIGATSQYKYTESDDDTTLAYIRNCMTNHNINQLDMLFVAYGHVKQEMWIERNAKKIPAKLSVGVGGTFDYVIGVKKRAPKVLINMNIEWLYKLITQPWRINRVLHAFPLFPIKVFLYAIKTLNN